MKYFTSDLHFNHRKILDFCSKRLVDLDMNPWNYQVAKSRRRLWERERDKEIKAKLKLEYDKAMKLVMDEMNEKIIERINKYVKKRDQLYIIGDFAFGNVADAKKILHKINGRKTLVKGNHDREARVMLEMGFHSVVENEYVKLQNGDDKIKVLMSHFPYLPKFWDEIKGWILIKLGIWKKFDKRYPYKRPQNFGDWLLHGYTHDETKVKDRMIHVGWEAWARPISEKEIIDIVLKN